MAENGAETLGPKEERKSPLAWELLLDEEFDRLYERLKREEASAREVRWGSFFSRAAAFSVDLLVLSLLSLALVYLLYVGYRVGLAAHRQPLSAHNLDQLLRIVAFAWLSLAGGYFVLFHAMAGQTIGKWLLGLKVVGRDLGNVTWGQSLVRWLGTVISAVSGLGFLWILFHRERRAWHDLLAGTWVLRER